MKIVDAILINLKTPQKRLSLKESINCRDKMKWTKWLKKKKTKNSKSSVTCHNCKCIENNCKFLLNIKTNYLKYNFKNFF